MKKSRMFAAASAAVVSAAMLAMSAGAYNGYIQVQTDVYSFRNNWDEANYGKATPYFNNWIVWANNDPEALPEYADNFDFDLDNGKGGYLLDATYTDVTIDADGTYTVKASDIDWAAGGDSDLGVLAVSTDIPYDAGITITDVKASVDGTVVKTIDTVELDPNAQYISIGVANQWTPLGFLGTYPTSDVSITFTISGLGGGAADTAATTATAGDVDAATDSSKGSPDTGIADVAVVAGIALAAGAGIALTRKRK